MRNAAAQALDPWAHPTWNIRDPSGKLCRSACGCLPRVSVTGARGLVARFAHPLVGATVWPCPSPPSACHHRLFCVLVHTIGASVGGSGPLAHRAIHHFFRAPACGIGKNFLAPRVSVRNTDNFFVRSGETKVRKGKSVRGATLLYCALVLWAFGKVSPAATRLAGWKKNIIYNNY